MAAGLDDALVGWLVASAGAGLVQRLRGDPVQASIRRVVEKAVTATVDEVLGQDSDRAEHLRASLLVHNLAVDDQQAPVTNEAELCEALRRWTAALNHPEFGESYLGGLGIDPETLANALTRHIADGIRRDGRRGGALSALAEWMWRDGVTSDVNEIKRAVDDLAEADRRRWRAAQMSRRPEAVPRQLPAVPADFTGRQRELTELLAHSTADAAVSPLVISGIPGVGKSAFALRLAHDLASNFPDGQLYGDMRDGDGRPIAPEVTLGRFLRALGTAPSEVPADPDEQAARYRSMLAGRRVLVVLDDAVSEQQVRPLLPGDPACLVLVTCRNPLPGLAAAITYPLGLLDPDESMELLGAIGGVDRVAADPKASRQIVELCGRLPLALRIAAARLRSRIDWTPAHVAARLSNVSRQLRELRVGDLDVRASFELSYQDLPADAARLFRRLATTPGTTFSGELAAVLSGSAPLNADEVLDRLVLDQLVQSGGSPDRYQMHPLMRVFAADLLVEHGDDVPPAMKAMFEWYSGKLSVFVDSGVPRLQVPSEARAWLDAEEPQLIPLLVASEQLGLDRYTASVAFPVAATARRRARWAEWKLAIDIGLRAADRSGDHNQQALLLAELGDYQSWVESDPAAQVASLTKAVELVNPVEAPGLSGRLHYQLAQAHQVAGRDAEAERELAAAVAAAELTDDDTVVRRIADQFRAETLIRQGSFSEAIDLLAPMAAAWTGPDITEIELRMVLARAYVGDRRYSVALTELKRCRELCREHAVRNLAPEVQLWLGQVYRALGFRGRARQAWREGLEFFETAGASYNPGTAARLAVELADSFARADDHSAAAEWFGRAARDFERAAEYCNRAEALDRQGQARLAIGDQAGAAAAWMAALSLLDRAGDPDRATLCRRQLHDRLRQVAKPG